MPLSEAQKKFLRRLAHTLKPVVTIGQAGVTPGVLLELDRSLETHELLKVRLGGTERKEKAALIQHLCQETGAELVQSIGHIAALYRPHPKQPRLELPRD